MNSVQPPAFPNAVESQKAGPAPLRGAVPQRSMAVLYKLAVSCTILLSILLVAGVWHLGANSMIACGFFGALFIHLGSRPSLAHVGWLLTAGMTVAFIYATLGGPFGPDTFSGLTGAGAFLGVGSI